MSRAIPNDGSPLLNKPFSPASLVTQIRQVLDGQSGNVSTERLRQAS